MGAPSWKRTIFCVLGISFSVFPCYDTRDSPTTAGVKNNEGAEEEEGGEKEEILISVCGVCRISQSLLAFLQFPPSKNMHMT